MIENISSRSVFNVALALIMVSAFLLKSYNLNYNSPFNDEAIYIVVGEMGIFQQDWYTYNADSWMAGAPYIYPSMAALSYKIGGIVGSRLLNVILGVLAIEAVAVTTLLLKDSFDIKEKYTAGIISAAVVGGSSVGYLVGRLATYDMPSFYFLTLSMMFLAIALKTDTNSNKMNFLAYITLTAAILSKIIAGIYVPIVLIVSMFMSKSEGKYSSWKKYFLIPFITTLGLYVVLNLGNYWTFYSTQSAREKAQIIDILQEFFNHTKYLWPLWFAGSLGMLTGKKSKEWLILFVSILWVLAFHIATFRVPTLDKHAYLSAVFIAITSGLGISSIIYRFKEYNYSNIFSAKIFTYTVVITLTIFFWVTSYSDAKAYNSAWRDNTKVLSALNKEVTRGSKILTELGAATLLSTHHSNHPTNVSTFDWLEYRNMSGEEAYANAVNDGYFDYLVLEDQYQPKSGVNKKLHDTITKNIDNQYYTTYEGDGYLIYKRSY